MKLIQEIYYHDPWKMLIGCIMLNKTSNKQVYQIIERFFKKYPTPIHVIMANVNDLAKDISSLGLQNQRAKRLKDFSYDWCYLNWKKISDCRGVGKYASDSYEIFVNKNFDVNPTDKVLLKYLQTKKSKICTRF